MKKAIISGGLVVLLPVLCLLPSAGWAAVTAVNCTGDTTTPPGILQTAINGASTGDTLQVSNTCTENVIVPIPGLILDGQGSATIDASTAGPTLPVVTVEVPRILFSVSSV
ncbi:MAG: hypothetical protein WAN11_21845 [Syntrophobacteraceae bacterium]